PGAADHFQRAFNRAGGRGQITALEREQGRCPQRVEVEVVAVGAGGGGGGPGAGPPRAPPLLCPLPGRGPPPPPPAPQTRRPPGPPPLLGLLRGRRPG